MIAFDLLTNDIVKKKTLLNKKCKIKIYNGKKVIIAEAAKRTDFSKNFYQTFCQLASVH